MQAVNHTHPRRDRKVNLCHHLRWQAATRRRHPQYQHLTTNIGIDSLGNRGHHRHIRPEAQQFTGTTPAVIEVNSTGNRVA